MKALTDRMSYSIFAVLVGGILLSQAIALGLYRSDRAEAVADALGQGLGGGRGHGGKLKSHSVCRA